MGFNARFANAEGRALLFLFLLVGSVGWTQEAPHRKPVEAQSLKPFLPPQIPAINPKLPESSALTSVPSHTAPKPVVHFPTLPAIAAGKVLHPSANTEPGQRHESLLPPAQPLFTSNFYESSWSSPRIQPPPLPQVEVAGIQPQPSNPETAMAGVPPKNAEAALAHYSRGNTLGRKGKAKKAAREYRTALDLNPGLKDAYIGLSAAYGALGRWEASLNMAQKALAGEGQFLKSNSLIQAHYNLGAAYCAVGRSSSAWEEYYFVQNARHLHAENLLKLIERKCRR